MPHLVKSLKDTLNAGLAHLGFRITSTGVQPWQPTLAAGLQRLARLNLPLRTLIDVGAANGAWARQAAAALPSCRELLLVEAQTIHRPALTQFQADFPHAHVALAVAGPTRGEVSFDANNPWDGAASERPRSGGTWVTLPQTTLDHEVASRRLPGPFIIKLDVHGYERSVLAGAAATLRETEALIVECYNFHLGGDALRFPAFCGHMEALGYRCADLWDPTYIGPHNMLWQFDLLFLRKPVVEAGDRQDRPDASV
jgi:FkbM family methyltransferase